MFPRLYFPALYYPPLYYPASDLEPPVAGDGSTYTGTNIGDTLGLANGTADFQVTATYEI